MCYRIVQVNFTIKDEAGYPAVRPLYEFEIPSLEHAEMLAERLFLDVERYQDPATTDEVVGIDHVLPAVEFPVALVNVHDGTIRFFSDQPRTDASRKPLSDALTAWEALEGYEYLPGDSIPGETFSLPEGHNPMTSAPLLVMQRRIQHASRLVAYGVDVLGIPDTAQILADKLDEFLQDQVAVSAANKAFADMGAGDNGAMSILDKIEQVLGQASKPTDKPKPHGLKVRGE